jgi:Ca2+/Na+ antiporter
MMNVLNYVVKIAIIIIGIIMLSGVIIPDNGDTTLYRIMGVVFILFGVYRIVMYKTKRKERLQDEEDYNDQN